MHDFAKHFKSDLISIQSNAEVSAGDTLLVYNPFSDTVSMFKVEYPDKLSLSNLLEYYLVLVNSDELEVGSYVRGNPV